MNSKEYSKLTFPIWRSWDADWWRFPREQIHISSLSQNDLIYRKIAKRRTFYELDLLLHLAGCGPRRGIAVDIGANIGNHTIFFSKFLFDFVIAIDASPKVFPVLQNNVLLNNLSNVYCINSGVGHFARAAFLSTPATDNLGMARVVDSDNKDGDFAIDIEPLDELLTRHSGTISGEPVRLIKIDVEGMQEEVIKGAVQTIEKHRPQLVIEAEDLVEYNGISDLLLPLGYHCAGRFCETPTYHFVHKTDHLSSPSFGNCIAKSMLWIRNTLPKPLHKARKAIRKAFRDPR
jgi:protein O-GlcNAc transferase